MGAWIVYSYYVPDNNRIRTYCYSIYPNRLSISLKTLPKRAIRLQVKLYGFYPNRLYPFRAYAWSGKKCTNILTKKMYNERQYAVEMNCHNIPHRTRLLRLPGEKDRSKNEYNRNSSTQLVNLIDIALKKKSYILYVYAYKSQRQQCYSRGGWRKKIMYII